jgi:hypothetical protein
VTAVDGISRQRCDDVSIILSCPFHMLISLGDHYFVSRTQCSPIHLYFFLLKNQNLDKILLILAREENCH